MADPVADPVFPGWRIEAVDYGHPDALRLTEEVQAEYVVRYGGRDDTPLDPLMFTPPQGSFFVGYLDPTGDGFDAVAAVDAVATGAWRTRDDVEVRGTTRAAEIKRMYVAQRARGNGLARAMLAHLEATAAAGGAEAMVLETGSAQPEAIALYRSSGYLPVASFGHYRDSAMNRCFGKRLG